MLFTPSSPFLVEALSEQGFVLKDFLGIPPGMEQTRVWLPAHIHGIYSAAFIWLLSSWII